MRSASILFASALALALAGCGSLPVAVAPMLPVLPGNLAARCPDPGVRAGQAAVVEIARQRQALATCAHRQRDTVAFYDDTRTRLRGKR